MIAYEQTAHHHTIAKNHSWIDVTAVAARAGFNIPVVVTSAIWADTQRVPERWVGHQDATCRLWDLLLIAHRQLTILPTTPTVITVPMEIDGVHDYQVRVLYHTDGALRGSLTIARHDEE